MPGVAKIDIIQIGEMENETENETKNEKENENANKKEWKEIAGRRQAHHTKKLSLYTIAHYSIISLRETTSEG